MLKRDQGGLCVYCMCGIPREGIDPGISGQTIEHFVPLDPIDGRDEGQGLDYNNLFVVCNGNSRMRKKGIRRFRSKDDLTCDKHRGNKEFRKLNPCDPNTLKDIYYTLDGEIGSSDPDVHFDLVEILNLNCNTSPIVEERKATLDGLIGDMGNVKVEDLHDYCTYWLDHFLAEKTKKTPYVGILIWYLRAMLKQLRQ